MGGPKSQSSDSLEYWDSQNLLHPGGYDSGCIPVRIRIPIHGVVCRCESFASDCTRDSIFYDKVERRHNVSYGGTVWQPFSTHVGD